MGHLKPITDSSLHNSTNNRLLDLTGCFRPRAGARIISPQDALIALGKLAGPHFFYDDKLYVENTVLKAWRTVAIYLVKIRPVGFDEFSLFDIASQVIEIVKFCVIQQPPGARFGGAFDVGSRNVFRVAVYAGVEG